MKCLLQLLAALCLVVALRLGNPHPLLIVVAETCAQGVVLSTITVTNDCPTSPCALTFTDLVVWGPSASGNINYAPTGSATQSSTLPPTGGTYVASNCNDVKLTSFCSTASTTGSHWWKLSWLDPVCIYGLHFYAHGAFMSGTNVTYLTADEKLLRQYTWDAAAGEFKMVLPIITVTRSSSWSQAATKSLPWTRTQAMTLTQPETQTETKPPTSSVTVSGTQTSPTATHLATRSSTASKTFVPPPTATLNPTWSRTDSLSASETVTRVATASPPTPVPSSSNSGTPVPTPSLWCCQHPHDLSCDRTDVPHCYLTSHMIGNVSLVDTAACAELPTILASRAVVVQLKKDLATDLRTQILQPQAVMNQCLGDPAELNTTLTVSVLWVGIQQASGGQSYFRSYFEVTVKNQTEKSARDATICLTHALATFYSSANSSTTSGFPLAAKVIAKHSQSASLCFANPLGFGFTGKSSAADACAVAPLQCLGQGVAGDTDSKVGGWPLSLKWTLILLGIILFIILMVPVVLFFKRRRFYARLPPSDPRSLSAKRHNRRFRTDADEELREMSKARGPADVMPDSGGNEAPLLQLDGKIGNTTSSGAPSAALVSPLATMATTTTPSATGASGPRPARNTFLREFNAPPNLPSTSGPGSVEIRSEVVKPVLGPLVHATSAAAAAGATSAAVPGGQPEQKFYRARNGAMLPYYDDDDL